MSRIQETINEMCQTVCRDICKYTEKAGGRNLLEVDDPNAMDDEEFDKFIEAYCWKCPINDAFME